MTTLERLTTYAVNARSFAWCMIVVSLILSVTRTVSVPNWPGIAMVGSAFAISALFEIAAAIRAQ